MPKQVQTRTVTTTVVTKSPRRLPTKQITTAAVVVALVAIGRASK